MPGTRRVTNRCPSTNLELERLARAPGTDPQAEWVYHQIPKVDYPILAYRG